MTRHKGEPPSSSATIRLFLPLHPPLSSLWPHWFSTPLSLSSILPLFLFLHPVSSHRLRPRLLLLLIPPSPLPPLSSLVIFSSPQILSLSLSLFVSLALPTSTNKYDGRNVFSRFSSFSSSSSSSVIVAEPPPCSSIYLSIYLSLFTLLVSSSQHSKKKEEQDQSERPTDGVPVFPSSFASLIEFQRVAGIRKWTSWFELCVPPSSLFFSLLSSLPTKTFFPSSFHQTSARKLLAFPIRVSNPARGEGGGYFRFSRSPVGIREDARDYRVSLLPR